MFFHSPFLPFLFYFSSKSCSIGMVLPLWSDTKIHLDGDGWVWVLFFFYFFKFFLYDPCFKDRGHSWSIIMLLFFFFCIHPWHFKWTHSNHLFYLLLRGFTVNTAGRTHVFKPVSVQAMWWVMINPWSHSGWLLQLTFMAHNNKSPNRQTLLQWCRLRQCSICHLLA